MWAGISKYAARPAYSTRGGYSLNTTRGAHRGRGRGRGQLRGGGHFKSKTLRNSAPDYSGASKPFSVATKSFVILIAGPTPPLPPSAPFLPHTHTRTYTRTYTLAPALRGL